MNRATAFRPSKFREDPLQHRQTKVLCQAAMLRLCALGFDEPNHYGVARLRQQFSALPNPLPEGLPAIFSRLQRSLGQILKNLSDETLQDEYLRLFAGACPCPPYETAYGDGKRLNGRPVELADINGFYTAFGIHDRATQSDLADHITAELEFLSILSLKEAYWLGYPLKSEGTRIVQRAKREFLAYHLGRWLRAFRQTLASQQAMLFYQLMATWSDELVKFLCKEEHLMVKPVSIHSVMRNLQEEEAALICPRESGEAPDPDLDVTITGQTCMPQTNG